MIFVHYSKYLTYVGTSAKCTKKWHKRCGVKGNGSGFPPERKKRKYRWGNNPLRWGKDLKFTVFCIFRGVEGSERELIVSNEPYQQIYIL